MRKNKWFLGVCFLAFLFALFWNSREVQAAEDKKAPTVTLKTNTAEPTSGKVKITIKAEDTSGIQLVTWAVGSKSLNYVKQSGKQLTLNSSGTTSVSVSKNNTYTFYARDKAGNETVKKITVSNIDTVPPVLSCTPNTVKPTNTSVTAKITVTDEASGIKEVQYLAGKKTAGDFSDAAQTPVSVTVNKNGIGSFKITKNGSYTLLAWDKAGNQTLQVLTVSNIDTTAPTVNLSYSVMNQAATVTVKAGDSLTGVTGLKYIKGKLTDTSSDKWTASAKAITANTFKVTSSGNYSVLATDAAGNQTAKVLYVQLEFKAVWISYLEFSAYGKNGYTEASFKSAIDKMFDNVVALNMNAVVVQVRPFGDALYPSSYFPWSKYISGTQGVDPGFDPLSYMVEAAHTRGLEFHAWLNPYRVTTASTNYSALSKDNPARIWYEDEDTSNDRNVLSYGGSLYYNPASSEVQTLVLNGIKEIVNNYDVDGIHFDDYFYPTLGTNYQKLFDYKEYNTYAAACKAAGKEALTIANWRRENVNTLIRNIYKSIKAIDSSVQFGISPGGFYNTLLADTGYYTDIKTWMSSDKYIDYICPQIYWGSTNATYPYEKTLDTWLSYRTSSSVKVYVGIATYKAGSTAYADWKNQKTILADQVQYGRDTGLVDGFIFFRYDYFYKDATKTNITNLLKIL